MNGFYHTHPFMYHALLYVCVKLILFKNFGEWKFISYRFDLYIEIITKKRIKKIQLNIPCVQIFTC